MGFFQNFPYTNFHSINLDWLLGKVKKSEETSEEAKKIAARTEDKVNNLDLQEEVNNKLDSMAADGTIDRIINDEIFGNLNSEISLVRNRKFVFIGDSYSTGTGGGFENTPWPEIVRRNLKLTEGVNYFKYAIGGAGFGTTTVPYNFTDQLELCSNAMSADVRSTITDIVVGGGANDCSKTSAEIINGIVRFMNFARANFPNAKVTVIALGWETGSDFRSKLMTTYYYYFRSSGYGYAFHAIYNILQNRSYMSEDNVHPLDVGYNAIGTAVSNILLGGTYNQIILPYASVSINNGSGRIGGCWIEDNGVHIYFEQGTHAIDPVNIGFSFVKISDITCYHLFGCDSATEAPFMKDAILTVDGSPVYVTLRMAIVKETDGTKGLYAMSISVKDGAFVQYNNVTAISFTNEYIDLPIWKA